MASAAASPPAHTPSPATRTITTDAPIKPTLVPTTPPPATGLSGSPAWIAMRTTTEGLATIRDFTGQGGRIEETHDGGMHWSPVWDGPVSLTWIGYTPSGKAIATGRFASDKPALVRRSGAQTWTMSVADVPIRALDWVTMRLVFTTDSVGFAVPDPVQYNFSSLHGILRTDDGGARWRIIPLPADATPSGGLDFIDQQHGFLTAWDAAGSAVWQTSDGGLSWTVLPSSRANAPLNAVSFVDARIGYAAGGNKPKYETPPWARSCHARRRHDMDDGQRREWTTSQCRPDRSTPFR